MKEYPPHQCANGWLDTYSGRHSVRDAGEGIILLADGKNYMDIARFEVWQAKELIAALEVMVEKMEDAG